MSSKIEQDMKILLIWHSLIMSTDHREETNKLKGEGKGRGKAPANDTNKEDFLLITHPSIP